MSVTMPCQSSVKELFPQAVDRPYTSTEWLLREQEFLVNLQAENHSYNQHLHGGQLRHNSVVAMNQSNALEFAPNQQQYPTSQLQYLYLQQMQGAVVDVASQYQQPSMPAGDIANMQVVEQHSCNNAVVQPDMRNQHILVTDSSTSPTDDSFVDALAIVTDKLLQIPRNSEVTRFHGVAAPEISVGDYLARIKKYFACSNECFVLSLIYMDRVVQKHAGFAISVYNWHRLVVTAVVLAAKFFDDVYYSNAYYGRVGGIRNLELNVLECHFLSLLDFHLFVSVGEYEQYKQNVCDIAAYYRLQTTSVPLDLSQLHANAIPNIEHNCRGMTPTLMASHHTVSAGDCAESNDQEIEFNDNVNDNALLLENEIPLLKQVLSSLSEGNDSKKNITASDDVDLANGVVILTNSPYCPTQTVFTSEENKSLRPMNTTENVLRASANNRAARHQAATVNKHFDVPLKFPSIAFPNAGCTVLTEETILSTMKQDPLISECVLPSFMPMAENGHNAVPPSEQFQVVQKVPHIPDGCLDNCKTAIASSQGNIDDCSGAVAATVSAILTLDDSALIDNVVNNSGQYPSAALISPEARRDCDSSPRHFLNEGHLTRVSDLVTNDIMTDAVYKENRPLHNELTVLVRAKKFESPEVVSWQATHNNGVVSLNGDEQMIMLQSHAELSQAAKESYDNSTNNSFLNDYKITTVDHTMHTPHQPPPQLPEQSNAHEAATGMSSFQQSFDHHQQALHNFLPSVSSSVACVLACSNNTERSIIPEAFLGFNSPSATVATTTPSLLQSSTKSRGSIDTTACRHAQQQAVLFHCNTLAAQQTCAQ
eukprot:Lankesteria_metandrocarpae@DN4892_c0_g1_i2.p1